MNISRECAGVEATCPHPAPRDAREADSHRVLYSPSQAAAERIHYAGPSNESSGRVQYWAPLENGVEENGLARVHELANRARHPRREGRPTSMCLCPWFVARTRCRLAIRVARGFVACTEIVAEHFRGRGFAPARATAAAAGLVAALEGPRTIARLERAPAISKALADVSVHAGFPIERTAAQTFPTRLREYKIRAAVDFSKRPCLLFVLLPRVFLSPMTFCCAPAPWRRHGRSLVVAFYA